MLRAISMLLLVGCEPEPPPAIDDVDWAAAQGTAVLRLEQGVLSLDGKVVGELREPGVLRKSRHRKLSKALKLRSGQDPDSRDPPEHALLSQDWPVRVLIEPTAPWDDLFPLLATSAWAGFGPFELALLPDGAAVGPLLGDTVQPVAWAGESISGLQPVLEIELADGHACAGLSFHARVEDGVPAQLPQRLRTMGTERLVDCGALFEGELVQICEGAGNAIGIPAGKRSIPIAWDGDPAHLQVDEGWRVVLAPRKELGTGALVEIFEAFRASSLPSPLLSLAKPRLAEELVCPEVKIHDAQGVRHAGARWIGEQRRPTY